MIRFQKRLVFRLCICALLVASVSLADEARKSDIEWKSGFDLALDLAQKSGKPLLIEFWASWCGPCKRMDQESWSNPRVVQLSARYVCLSVDADRDQDTIGRFVVKSLPTVVLADPWARTLRRREGFLHPSDLAAMMEEIPSDFSGAREIHETLARDPKNGLLLARMGQFFVKVNAPGFANQYYQDALKSKECKSDPTFRCELLLAIGMDCLALREWNDARKYLCLYLNEFPEAADRDRALLGLVLAAVKQGKRADAGRIAGELQEKFPSSPTAKSAERLLATLK